MKRLNFKGSEIEKTSEERAMECLYAYCSKVTAEEKKKRKTVRKYDNRNPRFVGH